MGHAAKQTPRFRFNALLSSVEEGGARVIARSLDVPGTGTVRTCIVYEVQYCTGSVHSEALFISLCPSSEEPDASLLAGGCVLDF